MAYHKMYTFDNGYGASVICSEHSYGGSSGLFEVAVLKGDDICYDTPITNDVLGYLDHEGVLRTLEQIKALPAA